jgi:hypothetical protein
VPSKGFVDDHPDVSWRLMQGSGSSLAHQHDPDEGRRSILSGATRHKDLLDANLENVEIAFAAWSAVQQSRHAERSMREARGRS